VLASLPLLQDGTQGRQKRLWNVRGGFVVEAPCRALMGQAGPEGLERPSYPGLTSCVRQSTNACLERIMAIWAWASSPLCLSG
jgi:hypothetical protein